MYWSAMKSSIHERVKMPVKYMLHAHYNWSIKITKLRGERDEEVCRWQMFCHMVHGKEKRGMPTQQLLHTTQHPGTYITVYAVMHLHTLKIKALAPTHMPFLSDLISVNHPPPYQACQMHLNTASSSSPSTLSSYPLFLALFRSCFMHAAGQWIIPYAETIFFPLPEA